MIANRIIAHVFLQASLHQVDVAAMERLVTEHPYFSAARILLAKKAYHLTGDLHNPAVKKAMLYSGQQHHFYQYITHEPVLEEVEDRVAPVLPEDTVPVAEAVTEEAPVAEVILEEIPATEAILKEVPVAEAVLDEIPVTEAILEEVPVAEAVLDEVPVAAVLPEETTASTAHNGQTEDSEALPIKIFPLKLPVEEETTLTFQPLYTDDYFAYKRLKEPGEADELNEQGMAEMKSFTSWLRQIKDSFAGKTSKDWYHQQLHRIYEEDEEPEVSATVEKMAMNSITFNNDIVSETLAEIWVRQHQYQNAISIYQKLSLLNPDKNAYFAQKIEELKSQTDKNKQ